MTTINPAPIRRSVTVEASLERAYGVFVAGMGGWWIKSHSLAPTGQRNVVIEQRAGGRWYEIGAGGEEVQWGHVIALDPPHRILLAWQLTADWAFDPNFLTELEVRFTVLDTSRTRVDLEHRKLDAYGARAEQVAGQLGSDNGWTALIEAFARAA